MNMLTTATEVRKRPRFNLRDKVEATFAGQPAVVTNISAEGIGMQHAAPLRINSAGSIRIESDENEAGVQFRGRVRWSRLSRTTNEEGKLLYNTGLQIEEASDAAAGLLGRLIRALGQRDDNSLQLKLKAAEEKAQARSTVPAMLQTSSPAPKINADHVLLIREAINVIANHPESAQEWYNRAKFSLAKRNPGGSESVAVPYRRDVIVIWEYLGGRIEPELITSVLDAESTDRVSRPTA